MNILFSLIENPTSFISADARQMIINLIYIFAAALFILGIKMLGKADTARKGNIISAWAMLIAVVVTFFDISILYDINTIILLIAGLGIGTLIGVVAAKKVPMTAMPELVALLNGFGGLASMLVVWAEFHEGKEGVMELFTRSSSVAAIIIGAITFTGSVYAYGKLSGKISGKAFIFGGQKQINALMFLAMLGTGIAFAVVGNYELAYIFLMICMVFALILGIAAVMPIGGGDMPVVISLLNSLSGLAASAAGFVIQNNVLIVAGCLVGASGVILTIIMCKAMNRTLYNVLFSGFGASDQSSSDDIDGEMKAVSVEDAYYVLEAAQRVMFIPGYGMAVAQAQHTVKELASLLQNNGAEVHFAIHPVAGRMPGHMNVLLSEADIAYEDLFDMDSANAAIESYDVAIVIGANDVVNPAAIQDKASPIYGMPIIEAYKAKTVYCLKRGQGAGFSGLVNKLFFGQNTRMIYGDAKATISELAGKFKES